MFAYPFQREHPAYVAARTQRERRRRNFCCIRLYAIHAALLLLLLLLLSARPAAVVAYSLIPRAESHTGTHYTAGKRDSRPPLFPSLSFSLCLSTSPSSASFSFSLSHLCAGFSLLPLGTHLPLSHSFSFVIFQRILRSLFKSLSSLLFPLLPLSLSLLHSFLILFLSSSSLPLVPTLRPLPLSLFLSSSRFLRAGRSVPLSLSPARRTHGRQPAVAFSLSLSPGAQVAAATAASAAARERRAAASRVYLVLPGSQQL